MMTVEGDFRDIPYVFELGVWSVGTKIIELQNAHISRGTISAYPTPSPPPEDDERMVSDGVMTSSDQTLTVGDMDEFTLSSYEEKQQWIKVLKFLALFPLSIVPDEPQDSPIKESLRSQLDPKKYNADSVWAVYIFPEEVGMRCHIIGTNVIAIKSRVRGVSIGTMEIFNAGDLSTPLITWDRIKLKRTGRIGNLLYLEIDRRCVGGPGLVWMYSGRDTPALKETLYSFVFRGDGKAIEISTSLPPPHKRRKRDEDSQDWCTVV